ncbi:MAG: intradiol ring-cleavage dioxygenase [Cyclobacteriaceae bacterium]|nr:intradiol ring-cleavage dioxygenase [Cyclobacteriaceae bacterium]
MKYSRKEFLRRIGAAGIIVPVATACAKDDPSPTTTTTSTTTTSGSCSVMPTETEGPFPYPGGEANNPLQRVDVTEGQPGVPLALTLTVVNVNNSCAVVSGARVDIWCCNKDGYYSGYGGQPGLLGTQSYIGQTWLRGFQLTDSEGKAKFTSIYPGWYGGRATHIHLEVFVGGVMKKTSQMAFSESVSDVVHVSSLYASHGINTTRNASDNIFNNSATDLASEMLSLTGSVAAGYEGTLTIGIAL